MKYERSEIKRDAQNFSLFLRKNGIFVVFGRSYFVMTLIDFVLADSHYPNMLRRPRLGAVEHAPFKV